MEKTQTKTRGAGYNDDQIARAVKRNFVSFADFISDLRETSKADPRLMMHIDRLLRNIYLHHLEGNFINKTQACRMIPAEHVDTCKKYVDEAKRLGFIEFKDDPRDGRKKNVVPTAEFLQFVRDSASKALDDALQIAGVGPSKSDLQ